MEDGWSFLCATGELTRTWGDAAHWRATVVIFNTRQSLTKSAIKAQGVEDCHGVIPGMPR